MNAVIADIRHDLLATVSRINAKQRSKGLDLIEETRTLELLYQRLADITGFKVKPHYHYFDLMEFMKHQLAELGLMNRPGLRNTISPDTPVFLETDGALLGVAVCQVLRNAAEAMLEGGSMALSVSRDEGTAHINVEDTGPGIPDHVFPRVFDAGFSHGKKNDLYDTGIMFDESLVDLVYAHTNGHSYHTQVILYHLYENQEKGIVSGEAFPKALEQSIVYMMAGILNTYGALDKDETRVLSLLAGLSDAVSVSQVMHFLVDRNEIDLIARVTPVCENLEERGILKQSADGKFLLDDNIIRQVLQSKMRLDVLAGPGGHA